MTRPIRIPILGMDLTGAAFASAFKRVGTLENKVTGFQRRMMTVGIGTAGVFAGIGASVVAGLHRVPEQMLELDDILHDIQSRSRTLTKEDIPALGQSILRIGTRTNRLPKDVADLTKSLLDMNFTLDESLSLSEQISKAISARGVDQGKAVEVAANGVRNLGMNVQQVNRIFDMFLGSESAGKARMEDMIGSFPEGVDALVDIGIKGEQAVAVYAGLVQALRETSSSTEDAVKDVNKIMTILSSPALKKRLEANNVPDRLNPLRAMAKAAREGLDPMEAFLLTMNKLLDEATSTDQQRRDAASILFGAKGGAAFDDIIAGIEMYRKAREGAAKADERIDREFEERQKSAMRQLAMFRNRLGARVIGGLLPYMEKVNVWLVDSNKNAERLDNVISGLKWVGILGGIAIGAVAANAAVSILVGTTLHLIRGLKTVILLSRFLATNPWILATTLAAGSAVAAYQERQRTKSRYELLKEANPNASATDLARANALWTDKVEYPNAGPGWVGNRALFGKMSPADSLKENRMIKAAESRRDSLEITLKGLPSGVNADVNVNGNNYDSINVLLGAPVF